MYNHPPEDGVKQNEMGKFEYGDGDTTHKGYFHIYQAKNGAIMLSMASSTITLTKEQVNTLSINYYELTDFDDVSFRKFYEY